MDDLTRELPEAADVHVGAIVTEVHGRYLVLPPRPSGPAPMIVGFHGYAEDADIQLARLRGIPGSERWLVVSIQALHRFYRRNNDVVASWMTRQDRDAAIRDNTTYVEKTVEAVAAQWPSTGPTLFVGFSQGVAMAFRAAVRRERAGVLAMAGDVPPELDSAALAKLAHATIFRGTADDLYPADQFARDRDRLTNAGVTVRALEVPGGHEWSHDASVMAASALEEYQAAFR